MRTIVRDVAASSIQILFETQRLSEAGEILERVRLSEARAARAQTTGPERLWTVTKDGRELRCLAVHLPMGIDVRLLEGGDFRRTELCRDVPTLKVKAEAWLRALIERGWVTRRLPR